MINKDLRNQLLLYLFVFAGVLNLYGQSAEQGKELWDAKGCAACHAKDMKTDLTGPALAGVRDRWESQDELYNWVRNSQEMIDAGHEYGNELFERFNKVPMLPFPDLTNEQIESILLYTELIASGGSLETPSAAADEAEAVADDYDEALVNQGKELFNAKGCMACHSKDMKTDLTGPALSGVESRWENRDELFNWIRNSQQMIEAGHEYGTALFEKYNKVQMLPYPDLTDEEIEALLAYIKYPDGPPKPADSVEVAAADDLVMEERTPFYKHNLFYILLFLIAGALTLVLAKTVADLKNQAYEKEFGEKGTHSPLTVLYSRSLLKFATFAFVVFGVYFTAIKAMNLGRQQNYEPDQPIIYSHKTHAGLHQIDCNFCHDGARRSKHATIPGTNTCMKCHNVIKNGSEYGTAELTKIFVSAGYDPTNNKYLENYEDMSEKELERIYKRWIEKMNPDFDSYKVNKQWEDIVDALTNEQKRKVQGPIEWIRIHNLPDHVYFSHEQHVSIGKIDCQKCHGPIEEMEVVRQYSPLSMGWCVNCHRDTKVQFADNPYYKNYTKFHEEIVSGERAAVTVEEIGGLSCQKCHY
jgi:cytochrome c2